ncbi:uncharacterized protein PG998_015180 [Apiospora kogelbergensis]|uniref:uncharacterized protein n=1 Tax=Apiospora kogelbergensis TaxID=1337665 RepID=UPI0031311CA2
MCMALRSWLRADNLHDEEVDQTIISVAERVEQDALEQLAYAFREEKAWEVPEKSVLVALVRYRNEIGSGTSTTKIKGSSFGIFRVTPEYEYKIALCPQNSWKHHKIIVNYSDILTNPLIYTNGKRWFGR